MSRASTSRLLATSIPRAASHPTLSRPLGQPWLRSFSQSASRPADNPTQPPQDSRPSTQSPRASGAPRPASAMEELARETSRLALDTVAKVRNETPSLLDGGLVGRLGFQEDDKQPYHFHIYAHKHNTHVTVTKPNRDAIISVSCGNLGFKKAGRKGFDPAFQVGAYVVDKLHQGGWHKKIRHMEVVLRGWGPGRDAVTRVLMGSQGKLLRSSIIRVSDATRLKFGGTRSRKPRRLG